MAGAFLALGLAPSVEAQLIQPTDRVRYLAGAGQAFDYRSDQFAEMQAFAIGQDHPIVKGSRFVVSTELTPVIFRQGTGRPGEKEWNAILAGVTMLAYRGGPIGDGIGYRVELGAGVSYGIRRVPAGGTKFNFYDEGGASVTLRRGARGYALGYRMVHLSNLLLNPNPGITFHTVSFALEWYK